MVELLIAPVAWREVGLHIVSPSLPNADAMTIAVGIVGATVMPHAVYLHSGLMQDWPPMLASVITISPPASRSAGRRCTGPGAALWKAIWKPRSAQSSGAAGKLTGKEEALLVATACSNPPEGRAGSTLELLAGVM